MRPVRRPRAASPTVSEERGVPTRREYGWTRLRCAASPRDTRPEAVQRWPTGQEACPSWPGACGASRRAYAWCITRSIGLGVVRTSRISPGASVQACQHGLPWLLGRPSGGCVWGRQQRTRHAEAACGCNAHEDCVLCPDTPGMHARLITHVLLTLQEVLPLSNTRNP